MRVVARTLGWLLRARHRGPRPGAVRRTGRRLALQAAAVLFAFFGVRALIALFAAHSPGERWLYGGVVALTTAGAVSSWLRAGRAGAGRA